METTKRTLEEFNNKHKLKYDGQVSLAVGNSKTSKHWKNRSIMYSALVDKLSQTTRTPETYAEYKKMSKTDRDRIKDVGGFVGGNLKEGRRKAENVQNRTLLTLDLDYVNGDVWESIELLFDFAVTMYSTHTHTAMSPRLRLIIPLARPVLPDEYQAIARMIASDLGIDQFDDTTYEPCRLMFWPSTSSDGEYVFKVQDLPWLNPDEVLDRYTFGWQDVSYWPESSRARAKLNKAISKQEDPLSKKGIIGAFCRTYSISEAIAEFLSEVYVPGADETRYTYAEGSTSGGVVVYDDKFSYSHHGTDPASCILCNAFDLVRIHKFGELDDEAKEDTPANRMPSFTKMTEFAANDKNVLVTIGQEKMMSAQEEFDAVEEEYDTEWLSELTYTKQGKIEDNRKNCQLIIENEPLLKGKLMFNDFAYRREVHGWLPWRTKEDLQDWTDNDDAGLRSLIETHYKYDPKLIKYNDGLTNTFKAHSYHPIKNYLNTLKWDGKERIETLLIDYLGADDNKFNRIVIKKWLVAGITRIYKPGTKFDTALIICGKQGTGKSTFLKKLGKQWFADDVGDVKNAKDNAEKLMGFWIVEMAEMAATKRADVEYVKQFISRTQLRYRPAYGHNAITVQVSWIYGGTTNEHYMLKDHTGNRRFWVVDVGISEPSKDVFGNSKNKIHLEDEVDQIWAEALYVYKHDSDFKIYLSREEEKLSEEQQKKHTQVSEIEEILNDKLDWDAPKEQWDKYNNTEICIGLNIPDRLRGYLRQNLKSILDKKGICPDRNKRYLLPPAKVLKTYKESFEAIKTTK